MSAGNRDASVPPRLCGSRVWLPLSLLIVLCANATVAHAQQPAGIEAEPIKCWWKTDRGAVRVGERFTLALTCGVIETAAVKVVPTLTQLDPGSLQVPPFEVVSGRRGPDIVSTPRRYFQYEYTVRLIGEGFFGQDVNVPQLPVTYNIQSSEGQGSQGRDQSYVLPPMPIRVLSLVPRDASDIRDASADTFSGIETRRFRATTAFTAAGIVFAFAALLLLLAAARVFGHVRQRRPARAAALAPGALLGGSMRALRDVKGQVMSGGWTPALARRSSSALRVAGAVALDRRVAQAVMNGSLAERDGQLALRRGFIRPRRVVVSASTTPAVIGRELANGHGRGAERQTLEQLQASLDAFNNAAYGRAGELDRTALDAALDNGTAAVRRLRTRRMWPVTALRKEQWASS